MVQQLSSFDDLSLSLQKSLSNSEIKSNTSYVSQYKQIKHLGGGASAQVIQVQHIKTLQMYAMKRIDKYKLHDKKLASKIRLEISLMKQFDHPNIIKLYTTFQDDKYLNMVMELAQMSLYDKLQQFGTLSQYRVVSYIHDIINALQYLHYRDNPIIHRDIKPQNIVITKNDQCKLTDFGSSNRIQSKGGTRDTLAGTIIYMPPQMQNKIPYDQSIDLWCLGILIYQLLVGVNPFLNMQQKDPDKIQFTQGFPILARDMVRRLLKIDPHQRMTLKQLRNHAWMRLGKIEQFYEEKDVKNNEYKKWKIQKQLQEFNKMLFERKMQRKQLLNKKIELRQKRKQVMVVEFNKVNKVCEEMDLLDELVRLKIEYRINADRLEERQRKSKKKQSKIKKQIEIIRGQIQQYRQQIKQLKKYNIKTHRNVFNTFQQTIYKLQQLSKKLDIIPDKISHQILYFRQVQQPQPHQYINLQLIKLTNKLLRFHKSALQQQKIILTQMIQYQYNQPH